MAGAVVRGAGEYPFPKKDVQNWRKTFHQMHFILTDHQLFPLNFTIVETAKSRDDREM
ncbi:MAG: hypothetical protein ABL874_03070 [Sphingopyxis sp.]